MAGGGLPVNGCVWVYTVYVPSNYTFRLWVPFHNQQNENPLVCSSTACFSPVYFSPHHLLLSLLFIFSAALTMEKPFNILRFATLHNPLFHQCPFLFRSLPPFFISPAFCSFSFLSFSHLFLSVSHSLWHTITLPPPSLKPFTFGPRVIFQKVLFNGNIFQMGKRTQPSNIPEVFEHHYTL